MTQADKITILSKFHDLNKELRALEKQCKELNETIKGQIPSGKYGEYLVVIEACERETFALKDAKTSLSPSILEKIRSFINLSTYQTLKVTRI